MAAKRTKTKEQMGIRVGIVWRHDIPLSSELRNAFRFQYADGQAVADVQLVELDANKPDLSLGHYLILAEAGGPDGRVLGGLQLVTDILRDHKGANPPSISLLSLLDRDALWSRTTGVDQFVVKSFPHYQVPIEKPILLRNTSEAKWRYLRKYALTSPGILDKLLHDVRNAIGDSVRGAERLGQAVKQLNSLPDLLDETLRSILSDHRKDMPEHERIEWSGKLFVALERWIHELRPERRLNRSRDDTQDKLKLMLVEDDRATADELTDLLEGYFEVTPFDDGAEALRELEVGGDDYSAVICDLELLEDGQRYDQPVQGIEVLEAAAKYHHIARRVITALPRRGVGKLLRDMRTPDILYKAHLKYGADGDFMEFLDELIKEAHSRRILKRMVGPSKSLWADVSREGGKSGGGFRSFYYRVKRDHLEQFKAMWAAIEKVAEHVVKFPDEEFPDKEMKVSTAFGKTVAAKTLLKDISLDENIRFLQMLLTHRMIMLVRYGDGSEVVYNNENSHATSYRHLPYWKTGSKPIKQQGTYMYFTGFNSEKYRSEDDGRVVRFTLKYGQVFEEEAHILKKYEKLREDRMDDFFVMHELLCICINNILRSIEQDGTMNNKYPKPKENAMNVSQTIVDDVLNLLAKEPATGEPCAWRSEAQRLLENYRDGEQNEFVESEGRPDYQQLPENLKRLVDSCIDSLT